MDQPMSQWPSLGDFVLPVREGPEQVRITLDGREVEVPNGELLIRAAQEQSVYIPRFCWHERMKPVGMCRMCLVEVEGLRGLQIACATPVYDGMVVNTQTDTVRKAQDGVLEFLLINHPLDCPVCDRGGECPLQDQTVAFGPGESRYVEEKRHFPKPISISELVLLDRERCIQCGRCTRFAAELAGDPLIDFGGRGEATEVITYPDEPFRSYFSGNTVQICPVGALTARPYRFKARPWDLTTSETACVTCAVQCRGALQSSSNRLVRLLGVDSDPVNQGWLCDKGRYGYEWVHAEERVREPLVRREGELVETTWPEALDAAAEGLHKVVDLHGPESVAVIGGGHGTNEDAYLWARLAKGVLGTDHVDAQLGDGLPADVVLGLPRARIADVDRAAAIVLLAPDLKEELPVLYLRVRNAVEELRVPLVELTARDTGLTEYATTVVRHLPGGAGEAATEAVGKITELAADRDGDIVVILGRPSLAEQVDATIHAASVLAQLPGVRFLSALRRGNVHGAIDLGLAPGFLPGRVTLDAGREHFTSAWGRVPTSRGLDTTGILNAAAEGSINALVLLGADPLADFPDRSLVQRALENVDFVVAVDGFVSDSTRNANVLLPVSVWGEKTGTGTNLEGRVQRLSQEVTAEGTTMPDWRIASEIALRFGVDFDLESTAEIRDEIARVAPAYTGVDASLLARARDGVVVPLAEHHQELVLDASSIPLTDASWEPIRPGTLASEEGLASHLGTGVVEATGTGSSTTVKPGFTEGAVPAADPAEAAAMGEAARAAGAELPPVHTWDAQAEPAPVEPRDAYALRLVVGRKLYDGGRVTSCSPSLAPLTAEPVVLVHRADRDRIGVPDGTPVRFTSSRGTVTLPVQADAATPQGVAFLALDPREPGAADLIDLDTAVTDLRVETIR
jgi:NADH-quinone oxidoreductase subunit G